MSIEVPKLAMTGWTRFDFTLMTNADNKHVLVSDEIVRDYLAYLTTCRLAHMNPLNFSSWLSTSPSDVPKREALGTV